METANRQREINDRTRRYSGIITPEQMLHPTIVGCGGIGSHLIRQLAQMGVPEITIADFDEVDPVNRGTQGFREQDIGKLKTDAMSDIIQDFGIYTDVTTRGKIEKGDTLNTPVIFFAVDSISVRSMIFKYNLGPEVQFLIDGRMAAEEGQIYAVDVRKPDQKQYYFDTLFPESEAVQLRCTEKATIYTGDYISSSMVALYKSFCIGAAVPKQIEFNLKTYFSDAEW